MAVLALGIAGAAIGGTIAPAGIAALGLSGAAIGWTAGTLIGNYLFRPDIPDIYNKGPQLSDLSVTSSTDGAPIPIIYGTKRITGNIIGSTSKLATVHTETQEYDAGKGGDTQSVTTETTTYRLGHLDVELCEGEISGVRRIWANKKILVDNRIGSQVVQPPWLKYRVYSGNETDSPDAMLEAYYGSGNVPGYLGTARCSFYDFPLADFGNQVPNLEFEVVRNVSSSLSIDVLANTPEYNPDQQILDNGLYWSSLATNSGTGGEDYIGAVAIDPLSGNTVFSCNQVTTTDTAKPVFDPIIWDSFGYNGEPAICIYGRETYSGTKPQPYVMVFSTVDGRLLAHYRMSSGKNAETRRKVGPYRSQAVLFGLDQSANLIRWSGASSTIIAYPTGYTSPGASLIACEKFEVSSGALIACSLTDTVNEFIGVYQDGQGWIADPVQVGDVPTGMEYDPVTEYFWGYYPNSTNSEFFAVDRSGALVGTYNWNTDYSINGTAITVGTIKSIFSIENGILWITCNGSLYSWDIQTLDAPHLWGSSSYVAATREVTSNSIISHVRFGGNIALIRLGRLNAGTQDLPDVIADICERCGIFSGQRDVSDLVGTVRGYSSNQSPTGRNMLEPLANAYQFDGFNSGFKLKFRMRGDESDFSIALDDLAAAENESSSDPYSITEATEFRLPRQIALQYFSTDKDQLPATQIAHRAVTQSINDITASSNVVFSDAEAATLAKQLLFSSWLERDRITFAVTRQYEKIEPADVIEIETKEDPFVGRVISLNRESTGIIGGEAVRTRAGVFSLSQASSGQIPRNNTVDARTRAILYLLDLPLLRNEDNANGFYLGASSYSDAWPGASVFKSPDDEVFSILTSVSNPVAAGYALDVLADARPFIWDRASSFTIRLMQGSLVSSTLPAITAQTINAAAIGDNGSWEIIQFATATENSDGTWTLSDFLRGRQGSEWATSEHAVGDKFVLLSESVLQRISQDNAQIAIEAFYKAVTFGLTKDSALSESFTNNAECLVPYAPAQFNASWSGTDIVFSWSRRSRIKPRAFWTPALSESSQSYEVAISGGSTLSASSETVTYTAAQQTADFGAPVSTVTASIYQISGVVGNGHATSATFTQ